MDVLQKWNRSIPDGNGTAAAVVFFLVFLFSYFTEDTLKKLYGLM